HLARDGRAAEGARPAGAAPVILRRIDVTAALIGHTNPCAEQIIEMNVDLSGRLCPDGDIDRLVLNDIADDGVAVERYAAGAAIHVDAGRAGRRVVATSAPLKAI